MNRLGVCLVAVSFLALQASVAPAEQTISCPSGKIDVLDWMTLDADLRATKKMGNISTVVYSDKFYWLKTPNGDTWDINLFDSNWIYLWITENEVWGTPTNYKKHYLNTNVKLAKRCASPGYPGEQQAIPDPKYVVATNCAEGSPKSLGRAVTGLWGPYTAGQPGLESSRPPIGGIVPNSTQTYTVEWRYGCNSQYTNCRAKEEYILTKRWGFVRWNYFTLQNGQYVLQNRTTNNQLFNFPATPYFPCF